MPISIDLRLCKRFAGFFNALLIICCTFTMILYSQKYASITMNISLFALASVCAVFFASERTKISFLLLHEGQVNKCRGIFEEKDTQKFGESTYILSEAHCVYSGLGCFLAFQREQAHQPWWTFSEPGLKWIFVPRYLLAAPQYKSLCRHLIWQRS